MTVTLAAELILAVWIIVRTSIRSLSPCTKFVKNCWHQIWSMIPHLGPAPPRLYNVDVLAIDTLLDLKAVLFIAEGLLLHAADLPTGHSFCDDDLSVLELTLTPSLAARLWVNLGWLWPPKRIIVSVWIFVTRFLSLVDRASPAAASDPDINNAPRFEIVLKIIFEILGTRLIWTGIRSQLNICPSQEVRSSRLLIKQLE